MQVKDHAETAQLLAELRQEHRDLDTAINQLASAIESGDPESATPTITKTTDPALPNGNNVQVDKELMGLSDTELRQQLLVEAVNSKFRLLRTVIVG